MDKQLLFQFLDACGLGVLSSLGPMDAPQSALAGIAITPELEIIFDLVEKSRKFANIARDPPVAFLMAWQLRPNPAGNCGVRVLKRSIPELFLVRVEAAGGFTAQPAGGYVFFQEGTGAVLGIAEALLQDVENVYADVQTDEVG